MGFFSCSNFAEDIFFVAFETATVKRDFEM